MTGEDRYLNRREAAHFLGVSPKTLARWQTCGILRGVKLGRGRTSRVVYRRSALEEWVLTQAAEQRQEARDDDR
jgi:predicted DNA-binding transcriptional regulator AlpA